MNGANAPLPPGIDPALQEDMERGIAAAQAGDKATAHRIFQSIAVRHADIPDIWVWVGGTSPTLDEAEAAFQRASMLDPNNEEAKLGLRWASLRRQATGTPARSTGSVSAADFISPNFDTGSFAANSAANGGMTQGGPQSSVPFGPAQPSPAAAAAEAAVEAAAETPAPVPAPVPKRGGLSVAAIIMILAIIVLVGVFIWLMYMQ